MQFPVVVLSLRSTALASILKHFPVNTSGETSVRPLITHLNAVNASPHPSLSSDAEQWNFDQGSRKNATGNLVFDAVHSFLQHWPDTRCRMVRSFSALCWLVLKECFISSSIGHNIVLGVFRTGVSLYHGTHLDTIPTESDWIATSPENSIIFCCGVDGNFWHLTLVAMRPLKVLYYTSVETVSEGTLDIQDVIVWGEPQPNLFSNEKDRAIDLCGWDQRVGQVVRNRRLRDISR
jgi:hypothetical protein